MAFQLDNKMDAAKLKPFENIAGFSSQTRCYNETLFRFPLRTAASKLSESLYTVEKVTELIEALKSEAELLLLFLRSVHSIEVYHIDQRGIQTLSFKVSIADSFVEDIKRKRASLLADLKSRDTSRCIVKFSAKFDIDKCDMEISTSRWLVVQHVGSSDVRVREASDKQKVFPWVGTAVRLDNPRPGNGRVFCFLPMPIEATTGLPVHINGTFGLNDDRRSLKWPGEERKNDPTADWNRILVSEVIPSCYVSLLLESKSLLCSSDFYKIWPDVSSLKNSQWEPLMEKVLTAILCNDSKVIFCQRLGEWIKPSRAVFIPDELMTDAELLLVVQRVLSSCGVKLAAVPLSVRHAFEVAEVPMKEVTPKLTRHQIRRQADSYVNLKISDKHLLLKYCLLDKECSDIYGLKLLPLCNGSFQTFQMRSADNNGFHYLCTQECQRNLLPNMDHKLVDPTNHPGLASVLEMVAKSDVTHLKILEVGDVAALLNESMPSKWQSMSIVPFPNGHFPSDWFKMFWSWVQDQQLELFADKIILPVFNSAAASAGHFNVVKLTAKPILYVPEHLPCSELDLTVLGKFKLFCCPQKFEDFSFVAHDQLDQYADIFNSTSILKAIACDSTHHKVEFSSREAACLRKLLCDKNSYEGLSKYYRVLRRLKIFTSACNTQNQLYSVKDACQQSLLKTCVVLKEDSSKPFDVSVLPKNIILFASSKQSQKQLLQSVVASDSFLNMQEVLNKHVFPSMKDWNIPDTHFDPIMEAVFKNFDNLNRDGNIQGSLESLPFVTTSSGVRRSPKDLYDPDIPELCRILYQKSFFPAAPYDKPEHLSTLRICGLQRSIAPQEILDTIHSISLPGNSTPQPVEREKLVCAKTILQYIGREKFKQNSSAMCSLPPERKGDGSKAISFLEALQYLCHNKCLLPVLASHPKGYPTQLPWKGEGFPNHLCTLDSNVSVSTLSSLLHPLKYGSQMYFTDPLIDSNVLLPQESPSHLVHHLQSVVDYAKGISQSKMCEIIHAIYSTMLSIVSEGNEAELSLLESVEKWVYIEKDDKYKFVSPATVAVEYSTSFRRILEPYLYKLPDSISKYRELFRAFGVNQVMSQEQIMSVLPAMKSNIENQAFSLTSVEECWGIVMDILNLLTENGTQSFSGSSDSIYVPVESESEWPDLREAEEVVYTDNDFFKKFLETDEPLQFVHSRISTNISECLQLTPLSVKLDIATDTFEDAGQFESLTTRLKNILRDYKDGLTIVKELIQNADDAEATEVNILFDARTHHIPSHELFFPGMADSHGPALVIHNNKVFSDEDFKNITKLAGATKQSKHLKIGKFGVGFCSVYHITDVPSFLSRDRLYIFDPTMSCLRKEIKNPSQPGKRLQFTSRVIRNSRQLDPYKNLYQFRQNEVYNGTIFRLPFRTAWSELSGKCYSENDAFKLLEDIHSSSESLILFLQNVHTITCQHINDGQTEPTTLYSVHKVEENFSPTRQEGILGISIDSAKGEEIRSSKWLVSQQHNNGNDDTKYAVASVACKLKTGRLPSSYHVCKELSGEVFCYLPLAQSTGLPVHVSCNFAVINNRRGIWTAEESHSTASEPEVKWNNHLMETVVPRAYLKLLCALKDMHTLNALKGYSFHDLWPLSENLKQQNPWSLFITKLYSGLSSSDNALFYTKSLCEWISIDKGKLLKSDIFNSKINRALIAELLIFLKLPLINLPLEYQHTKYFDFSACLIDQLGFVDIFFSNLQRFSAVYKKRNAMIQSLLEVYASESDHSSDLGEVLRKKLADNPCIPCSPQGENLKKCEELINPRAKFSNLYDASDCMFVWKELVKRDLPQVALKKLGMISDSIPWEYVIERAQTVQLVFQSNPLKAYKRVQYILTAITNYTNGKEPDDLSSIDFLPVLKKPSNFHLQWPGDGMTFSSGNKMMLSGQESEHVMIAGSQSIFVCENDPKYNGCGPISSSKAKKTLGLKGTPSIITVMDHFKLVISTWQTEEQLQSSDWVEKVCRRIYAYLEKKSLKDQSVKNVIQKLKDLPCIWTGRSFIHTNEICFDWTMTGPYLYKVPEILSGRKKLCDALSIKQVFSLEDIKNALVKMQADYKEKPVGNDCRSVIKKIVPLLQDMEEDTLKNSCLPLPDENYCLHSSKDLAYNDVPWMIKDATRIKFYVHPIIPRELATRLGVKPVRTKFLEKYTTHGFKRFGQKEDLTRRIQNILRDYPLDVTLLKELLQNADDAKATKMYVILDKRFHAAKSILSEKWEDLQGPAMLVWNDSVFSAEDLEGIQELGLGSKRSEADTIGQYGIGFNVVYHITDCPSFVSNDETMCIMDPHCRYVPEANECSPGGRYDELNKGLWQEFPDMQYPYLRKGLSTASGEVNFKSGSLFRFPIRHGKRKMSSSKIVDNTDNLVSSLSSAKLEEYLKKWMCKMKQAMLFLNNVTELKLLIIEENSDKMKTVFHFTSKTGESAHSLADQKEMLQKAMSSFKPEGSREPHTITYPLSLSEVISNGQKSQKVEKWLIQQGVGNAHDRECTWHYLRSMKPRHGIAAPLSKCNFTRGQVFCFLPLPANTDLPVHVNGHFILDSNRRGLWSNADIDSRSEWNNNLIKALASSYAEFLVNSRGYCVKREYKGILTAINEMLQYYNLFPVTKRQSNQWKTLSQEVYEMILKHNLCVICVIQINPGNKGCSIQWLSARSSNSSMAPIYYWPSSNYTEGKHGEVYPILERIGMKITPAPSDIMSCFIDSKGNFCPVTRRTIFDYYIKFASGTMKPTVIEETDFKSVGSYLIFTNYILAKPEQWHKYPASPFNHYLLLTADKFLRKFVESSKALASHFSNIFPNSLSSFLHPSLLSICYEKTYLMQPDDDQAESLVLQIMKANLPQEMRSVSVQVSDSLISRDRLQSLWKCFKYDDVFNKHLPVVLKEWALLLSQDNWLFSSGSQIIPVRDNETTRHKCTHTQSLMLNVLKTIQIPFLDTTVVVVNVGCPTIANGLKILSNLYYSDKKNPISDLLSKEQLNVVIDYLQQEVMTAWSMSLSPPDQDLIQQLRSLPLFENIDGDYISLNGRVAYVWPENACDIGYKKWLEGFGTVFIKRAAKWSQLGSAEFLSIEKITTAELYVKFIFHNFDKMNTEEKTKHLEFIRDRLYSNIERDSKRRTYTSEDVTRYNEAVSFISYLRELRCILGSDGSFYKIADFCDHTVEIFETFPKSFKFLPQDYKKDDHKWLPFFRGLGLRQSVSRDEFLKFCRDTASRKMSNLKSCSNVLLEYLFGSKPWINDTSFYQQVSEIQFVFQEELPDLNWLAHSFISAGEMVKLKNSAPLDQATLLWTLKPIVCLPTSSSTTFEEKLGISTKPSFTDVITNIKNICDKSQYAKQELFAKYHLTNKGNLLQIMEENLKYLYLLGSNANFDCLKLLPCIPVHNTTKPQANDRNFVLVKPCEVVYERWDKAEVFQFHPFLHCLPDSLQSISSLLQQIGVKSSLDLCHIQKVLEGAYKASEGNPLDPNTERCVRLAINLLADKFLKKLDSTTGDVLSPLYLPDATNVLKSSKALLYGDTINYWKKIKLDLTSLQGRYSHFDIKMGDYHVQAATFCQMLPESVRPVGLSSLCKQVIPESCKKTKASSVAEQLQNMIKMEELTTGIVQFLHKFIGTKDDENDLKKLITSYFHKIEVMTVADLKVEIKLKEGNKFLGTLNTKFCFAPSVMKSMLYLDSNLSYSVHTDGVYSDIASDLCKNLRDTMKSEMSVEQESKVIEFIKTCLKVSSLNDLIEILSEEYDISVDEQMRGFKKRIGEIIPNCWHHRLEQDMYNVFNPMEYVGYENEDGKLIVAQIVYPVASTSSEECSHLVKKYRIYVKEDDEEGIEVSSLSLYKFIVGMKKPDQSAATSEEKDIAVFDEDAEIPKLRSKLMKEDLVAIMKEICSVLREIWKLPKELKKKAIKRLFLKWHPDKNDNKDVAEEAFKFLMKQIEHLEKGEPLDDPVQTQTFSSTSGSSGGGYRYYGRRRRRGDYYYYSSWFNFQSWEDTAHRHSYASDFEDSYFYGGGGGARGGYSSQSFYPFFKTRHEKNPSEGKRWLLQAKGEFEILTALHGQLGACPGYSYVCFIAHQVAEKALKGGVYTLCGLDGRSLIDHNLSRHALALEAVEPKQTKGLAQHAIRLDDYYLKTRYPNKWPNDPNTPLDHYTQVDADGAKENAKAILDTMLAIIHT